MGQRSGPLPGLQRRKRFLFAAAGATSLLVLPICGSALAGSSPDSVTIPLTRRPGTSFPNIITVTIAGGTASPVTFHAGSIGLYVLVRCRDAQGESARPLGKPEKRRGTLYLSGIDG
jgi:hypothetical protein